MCGAHVCVCVWGGGGVDGLCVDGQGAATPCRLPQLPTPQSHIPTVSNAPHAIPPHTPQNPTHATQHLPNQEGAKTPNPGLVLGPVRLRPPPPNPLTSPTPSPPQTPHT